MQRVKRLMVDIETLSTRENAACIAIGAVCLESDHRFVTYLDIGLVPGHRDESTLDFWRNQDPTLKRRVFGGTIPPPAGCQGFRSFYQSARPDEIWANPPQFDLVIMRNLFRECNVEIPWHFTQERDFRTLKNLAKERRIDYQTAYEGSIKHDPLSDAECQARAVEIILSKL